jgi:luciferase family oxidoreductase group 1
MIKLSILDQSPIRNSVTPAEALHETLALAELADGLGYHRYWLAEHHSSNGLAGAAPEVLIPMVASRTKQIRVGSGGVMLSHYSPLKVAEQFRVLEALFPGRIDLGVGRAPGSDQLTSQAMAAGPGSLGPQHYPSQVRDLMGYLAGALPGDHPFKNVRAMPAGPAAPPVWLLGSSGESASIAAYFGCPFSFAHFITAEQGPQVVEAYRKNFEPSPTCPEPVVSIGVFAMCADTDEEAAQLMKTRDLWTVRQRQGITAPVPTVAEAEDYAYSPREDAMRRYNRERCIWGAPETVHDGLTALTEAYGIDEIMILTICPEFTARCRSYELLADAFDLPQSGLSGKTTANAPA